MKYIKLYEEFVNEDDDLTNREKLARDNEREKLHNEILHMTARASQEDWSIEKEENDLRILAIRRMFARKNAKKKDEEK